jgi:hypothetical protein
MVFASTHEGITRDRAPQCPKKKTRTIEKINPSRSLNAFEPREHFFRIDATYRTDFAGLEGSSQFKRLSTTCGLFVDRVRLISVPAPIYQPSPFPHLYLPKTTQGDVPTASAIARHARRSICFVHGRDFRPTNSSMSSKYRRRSNLREV